MKSKELFPGIFSRHAPAYQRRLEDIMARKEARGRQRVLDLIEAKPGMRVLDLACGPATLSRRLAEMVRPGGEVVGVDLAPGMIELARAAGIPNARFEVMDLEHLGFPDQSFDVASCGHGLQFVPEVGKALSEAHRVLRPGGRFGASIPASTIKDAVTALLEEVLDRWLPPAPRAIDRDATVAVVSDPEALKRAALAARFATARVEVIEEQVTWESAEQLVSLTTSWWDCAARLERIDPERRRLFMVDATATLRQKHPGALETGGSTHVLFAIA